MNVLCLHNVSVVKWKIFCFHLIDAQNSASVPQINSLTFNSIQSNKYSIITSNSQDIVLSTLKMNK